MAMTFEYYNRRPDGKRKEDCVCRAISTTTGLKYEAVDKLLEMSASDYSCDKLCVCCYHHLLEDILCYNVKYCMSGETVREVAKDYPHYKLCVRVDGHLTSTMFGKIADTWDCGEKIVDCFWIID